MRQHVNPLSKNFNEIEIIPSLNEIFLDPKLPLHLDIGCASGNFLFDLALENKKWNYLGIEIRQKLVKNANLKLSEKKIKNLYFAFGNAYNLLSEPKCKFILDKVSSISFYFPDPWFKKKHYKRRIIQPNFISLISNSIAKGSLIFIKTDVEELFHYMDFIISNNSNFKKIDSNLFEYYKSFNPNKILTNREIYVTENKLSIFERIYRKS